MDTTTTINHRTSSSQHVLPPLLFPCSLSSSSSRLPSTLPLNTYSNPVQLRRLNGHHETNSGVDGNQSSGFKKKRDGKPWARLQNDFMVGKGKFRCNNSSPLDFYKAPSFAQHYVITLAGEGLKKVSPIKVNNAIVLAIGKPTALSIVNANTINVCVVSEEQGKALTNLKRLGDLAVSVASNSKLNTSQGTIKCPFLSSCTREELLEALKSEGVVEVIPLVRGREFNGPSDTYRLTFSTPKVPQTVSPCLLLCKLKVRPFIPEPLRCFKCLKFGHQAKKCSSPQELCACGLARHKKDKEACKSPPSCINCRSQHGSLSRDCPVYRKEMAIQAYMVLEKVTYVVARKLYNSSSLPSVSPLSYADKVRGNPPSKVLAQSRLQEAISSNLASNLASKLADSGKAALSQLSFSVPPTSQVHRGPAPAKRNRKSNKGKKPVPVPSTAPLTPVVSKTPPPSHAPIPSICPAPPTSPPPTLTPTPCATNEPDLTTLPSLPPFCAPSSTLFLPSQIDSGAPLLAPVSDVVPVPSPIDLSPAHQKSTLTRKVKDQMCLSDPLHMVEKREVAGFVPISNSKQVESGFDRRWKVVYRRKRRRKNPDSRLQEGSRQESSPLETSDSEDYPLKKKKKKGWPKGKPRKSITTPPAATQP